jgi:ABC-type Fe3+-hydroxamate transport system substrate-binding protein
MAVVMRSCHVFIIALLGILISAWIFGSAPGFCNELRFTDGTGNEIQLTKKPERIVSLVPSITEMMFALGAQDLVTGITYHTTRPWYAAQKTLVGGFSFPSPAAIEALEPDLVFYDQFQLQALSSVLSRDILRVHAKTQTLKDSLDTLLRLGDLVEKQENARHLVAEINADLDWVTAKMRKADLSPKLVIRLMGREQIMTPGRDSFQNHMISLAGGIPPDVGTGAVVPVSKDQWTGFNPQVIYGCGSDREAADHTPPGNRTGSSPVWQIPPWHPAGARSPVYGPPLFQDEPPGFC